MSLFRNLVALSADAIPFRYKQMPYIEITTSQGTYIDLDTKYTYGIEAHFDLEPYLYSSNWTTILQGGTSTAHRFFYNSEGSAPKASVGISVSSTTQTGKYSGLDRVRNLFVCILKKGEFSIYVDGLSELSISYATTYNYDGENYKCRILATKENNDRYRGKIYGIKFYEIESRKLIHDMYPVYDTKTSQYGLYDKVKKTFYSGVGAPFEYSG